MLMLLLLLLLIALIIIVLFGSALEQTHCTFVCDCRLYSAFRIPSSPALLAGWFCHLSTQLWWTYCCRCCSVLVITYIKLFSIFQQTRCANACDCSFLMRVLNIVHPSGVLTALSSYITGATCNCAYNHTAPCHVTRVHACLSCNLPPSLLAE